MTQSASSSPPRRPRSSLTIVIVAALLWCAFIFGTSSTVILPREFFAWFSAHVFTDEAQFRRFAVFWGVSWFAIVKGWHATEFAILFLLVFAVLERAVRMRSGRALALAIFLSALFAISDEYHQTFVPGRGGTWRDVAIDCFGIGLAGAIVWSRRRRMNHEPRQAPPDPTV